MDSITEYLIKSGIALTVFYFFYWMLMRRSTYFVLNRLTLVAALIGSLILPLIRINLTPEVVTNIPVMRIDLTNVVQVISKPEPFWGIREIVLLIYFFGVFITLSRLIYQSVYIHVLANMSNTIIKGNLTIVLVEKEIAPFAYFSKIFIPASKQDESSFESILAHEKSHLRQYHFVDLFLIEIITIVQWFNPIVWLYERTVKEVHEYLADEEVLKQGASKGNYQALLVNQALGGPVFTISHQFNQSLVKKRIIMMTKMKTPRMAKIKALLFVPLTAGLLMAFSNPGPLVRPVIEKVEAFTQQITDAKLLPENGIVQNTLNAENGSITIKGKVLDESTLQPVKRVCIIVKGTTTGTISDPNGNFKIKAEASPSVLVFSHIGYTSVVKEFTENSNIDIHMSKTTAVLNEIVLTYPGEKPNMEIKPDPYVIIDGVPSDRIALNSLDPNNIESVSVLKDENATSVYGEKGKNGVILVITKKENADAGNKDKKQDISEEKATGKKESNHKQIFTMVEQMPSFPGGENELNRFMSNNLRVPDDVIKSGLQGTVYATFIVKEDGSIADAKIISGIGKSCDEEVLRVINLMPKWIPGKQNGEGIPVQFNLPVKYLKQ